MPGNSFSKKLIKEAYEKNEISDEELKNNAEIIKQNYDQLYENRKSKIEYDKEKIKEIAYEVAKESPILLKNNNVLPLRENEKILVVGELFEHPNVQGFGSSRINYENKNSFINEFNKYDDKFTYVKGYSLDNKNDKKLAKEAINASDEFEKIIFFMGYIYDDCEGVYRKNIDLPLNQLLLLNELIKLNKQIVVVLNTGNVVELPFKNKVDGILQSGLLGEVHEKVITEILFGIINPSGKLNETYPNKLKDNPFYFNNSKNHNITNYKESIYTGYRYYDSFKKDVCYPFGYGLSYSKFIFSNLQVTKDDEYRYNISFIVENDSDIDGSEVCQVYVRKKTSNTYHSYQQLKGFKKVFIKAHEKVNVQIILEDHTFEFYNDNSHMFEIESGVYEICVGNSSRNIELVDFINIEGNETELRFKVSDLSSYYRYKTIEDFEFQKLLGFSVLENKSNKIDFNSNLSVLKNNALGKIIYENIKKEYLAQNNFLPSNMALEMLDFLPIRMLVIMSNGQLSYEFAKEIINAVNSGLISGTIKLLKTKKKISRK